MRRKEIIIASLICFLANSVAILFVKYFMPKKRLPAPFSTRIEINVKPMRNLFIFLLLLVQQPVTAQNTLPYFDVLSVENGLPEGLVTYKLQDKAGYLWLGTQNGLVRYDGYTLKPYSFYNESGKRSVTSSVRLIFEDEAGKIWVQLFESGLYYLDRKQDKFLAVVLNENSKEKIINHFPMACVEWSQENSLWILAADASILKIKLYQFNTKDMMLQEWGPEEKGKYNLPLQNFRFITKLSSGDVWLCADNSLYRYEASSKTFKSIFTLPSTLPNENIFTVIEDPQDTDILWMATDSLFDMRNVQEDFIGHYVIKFNRKTGQHQVYHTGVTDDTGLLSNCNSIVVDSLNRLWFLHQSGVASYDAKTGRFKNYKQDQTISFNSLAADKKGNLWLGGNASPLYYLDIQTGTFQSYPGKDKEGYIPSIWGISEIFYDRFGGLWINIPFQGIIHTNRLKSVFTMDETYQHVLKQKEDDDAPFRVVGAEPPSVCFIANKTDLYAWHTRDNRYEKITIPKIKSYNTILRAIIDAEGIYWIASNTEGLFRYDPATRLSKQYLPVKGDSNSIASGYLSGLAADKEGNIWIATSADGLCKLHTATLTFVRYPFSKSEGLAEVGNELDDNEATEILVDHEGVIWITTDDGFLNSYHPKQNKFTSYADRSNGLFAATNLFEDSKHRLWVGSYMSGLFLFDKSTHKFKAYTEAEGLAHNCIMAIEEDNEGNIWVSTYRGLSRLNPETDVITRYPRLTNNAFLRSSNIYKDGDGSIRLNLQKGILRFNPADLEPNPIVPSVVIQSLQFPVSRDGKLWDSVVHIFSGREIQLKYHENRISFQFVALHFTDAQNNQYAFKLDGYDKDWIQAGTQRTAVYTNLSPGKYSFHVKAANGDGLWNETGASVSFTINPPWWKKGWAYGLYAILGIGALFSLIAYRSAALKKENKLLEEKVNLRTQQLSESVDDLKNTQSQLVHAEKMASLGELTAGIAHEIQNPLNFVNNFSEVSNELIDEMNVELNKGDIDEAKTISLDIKQNLEKINFHGKRADAIVRGMLQHSRTNRGQKEPTDINALCDEYLRLSFHGLRAKDKTFNAGFESHLDPAVGKLDVIPQDIGRVILNLINNAFYAVYEKQRATDSSYKPMVIVQTDKYTDHVEIKVRDNGFGIEETIRDKIFQPFFTTKPTGQGTGLGLSMSYEIVSKGHGGEIKVESTHQHDAQAADNDSGTTFTISLPIQ